MAFLKNVLQEPHYGYERDGELYVPTVRELFREYASRVDFLSDRKNWWPFFSFFTTFILIIPVVLFFTIAFDWRYIFAGLAYSLWMNIHGTAYIHRYCSHHAFSFRNRFWLFLFRNLSIKVIMEEVFAISHYVHHRYPEEPGDPYNTKAGRLYCLLSDVNHQQIRKDLNEADYLRLARLMKDTGVRCNTFAQYQKWGSITHPGWSIFHYALNWGFWFSVFYLMGGLPLALAIFGAACGWGVSVRNFNYKSHGSGEDRRIPGRDFNQHSQAINIPLAGYTAGEWHSNHHLYPTSARCDFQPGQFDTAWMLIAGMAKLGIVTSYKDYREAFLRNYYVPYLKEMADGEHLPAA